MKKTVMSLLLIYSCQGFLIAQNSEVHSTTPSILSTSDSQSTECIVVANQADPDDIFELDAAPQQPVKRNNLSLVSVLTVCKIYCAAWYQQFVTYIRSKQQSKRKKCCHHPHQTHERQ